MRTGPNNVARQRMQAKWVDRRALLISMLRFDRSAMSIAFLPCNFGSILSQPFRDNLNTEVDWTICSSEGLTVRRSCGCGEPEGTGGAAQVQEGPPVRPALRLRQHHRLHHVKIQGAAADRAGARCGRGGDGRRRLLRHAAAGIFPRRSLIDLGCWQISRGRRTRLSSMMPPFDPVYGWTCIVLNNKCPEIRPLWLAKVRLWASRLGGVVFHQIQNSYRIDNEVPTQ